MKNQEKTKKGLGLIFKFNAILLIPMVLFLVVSILALDAAVNDTAVRMVEHELNVAVYALEAEFNMMDPGEY
ncbi:MAG: hypothetical protein J6B39_08220, partial [Lachnospiraceae bacterium]|nr:hypothetical protein [Lachnospiraceae bacterium]